MPCILVERRDLNAGASGANHGLLHSGGRYVSNDEESARDCRQEGELLKRLAPHCVEQTGGLFVALEGDDEQFIADFPLRCERCGVPAHPLDPAEARELEPALSRRVVAAFEVQDATVDPFKLSLENMAHARALGARSLTHHRVEGFELQRGRVRAVGLRNLRTGEELRVEADEVVNAAGAWAGEVAALAGIQFEVIFSKGTLVVTQNRVTRRVVNRLRRPSNADIIVPGGTVSILGTTSVRLDSLDDIAPTVEEVDTIMEQSAAMTPALQQTRVIRAYAGVRPLVRRGAAADDRSVSRGLALFDHAEDGVENLISIAGGKLTTFRDMAEQAADMVCAHLGVTAPCLTQTEPLPESNRWTVPGASPRAWLQLLEEDDDTLLCECELVTARAVDQITAQITAEGRAPTLEEIGLRSRVGKGSCQGTFCSLRLLAHLCQQDLDQPGSTANLRAFLDERFKGERTVLWGTQMGQVELMEALHCGLLGLEL